MKIEVQLKIYPSAVMTTRLQLQWNSNKTTKITSKHQNFKNLKTLAFLNNFIGKSSILTLNCAFLVGLFQHRSGVGSFYLFFFLLLDHKIVHIIIFLSWDH
jgi:hypothetical protein